MLDMYKTTTRAISEYIGITYTNGYDVNVFVEKLIVLVIIVAFFPY